MMSPRCAWLLHTMQVVWLFCGAELKEGIALLLNVFKQPNRHSLYEKKVIFVCG